MSAATASLVAVIPVLLMTEIKAGPVPPFRLALKGADRLSVLLFATDGWICAGFSIGWALVLFQSLGSNYEAFGWIGAGAGAASAVASVICGRALDRGKKERYLVVASVVTVASILLRAFSCGSPTMSVIASLSGAAVSAFYIPVLLSIIYAHAKDSGRAYGFHLTLEAGWDFGVIAGTLVTVGVATLSPIASLCVLPSVLGVAVVQIAVSRVHAHGRMSLASGGGAPATMLSAQAVTLGS